MGVTTKFLTYAGHLFLNDCLLKRAGFSKFTVYMAIYMMKRHSLEFVGSALKQFGDSECEIRFCVIPGYLFGLKELY